MLSSTLLAGMFGAVTALPGQAYASVIPPQHHVQSTKYVFSLRNQIHTFGQAFETRNLATASRSITSMHAYRSSGFSTQTTVNGINIIAGDKGVPYQILAVAQDILSQVSTPALTSYFGSTPTDTNIVLYSSPRGYAKALMRQGIDFQEIRSIVSETGGLTLGSDVLIPLYNLNDSSDLGDVLTHELTHVILNQQGIGDTLPTWINEGLAWELGFAAHTKLDSQMAGQMRDEYTQELQDAKQSGQLLPITATEDDILNAQYNVEWEDYLAVDQLIQTYGQSAVDAFLKGVKTDGLEQSFHNAFHISMTDYENQFDNTLTNS